MKVLLGWLADLLWIVYAVCGVGALVSIVRALSQRRRLQASLTLFEREAITARVNRSWGAALAFLLVGLALFGVEVYLLPRVVPEAAVAPTPTVEFGLLTPTPTPVSYTHLTLPTKA